MPWLTPDSIPGSTTQKTLDIPDNEVWEAAVRGALYELALPQNWEQHGTLTPDQVANRFMEMLDDFLSQ